MSLKTVTALLSGALCAGCLEDGGRKVPQEEAGPVVLRARMTAPIVSGMNFRSGSQVGVTDADGYLTYELGEPIHLAVAGVDLGVFSVRPRDSSALSPVPAATSGLQLSDLALASLKEAPLAITSASLSFDPTVVVNIGRLFLMADSDGNSANNVTISAASQQLQPRVIDLASVDIERAAEVVRNAVIAADGGAHPWPSADEARAYLEVRRTCSLTGLYVGRLTSPSVGGDITAVALPPFGDIVGFVKTRYGDPYYNGLFHFSLNPDSHLAGNIVSAEIPAALHSQGADWPAAPITSQTPPLTLYLDWINSHQGGGWFLTTTNGLSDANGTFETQLVVNTDSSGTEFAAVHRFVQFPARWTHAQGHTMYQVLVVEIDRTGAVSARLLHPMPGFGDSTFVTMQGAISANSEITATSRDAIAGGVSWQFDGVFDRDAMMVRNARLYQRGSSGMVVADDFNGEPILGCPL